MLIARRGEKISLDFSFPSSPSTSLDFELGWDETSDATSY